MAKFQLLECHVAIGGDILNVVHRHAHTPVTFPELLVLRYVHGENSVTEVFEVGHIERDEAAEYARLCQVYDAAMIREKLFPGAAFRLPHGESRYRRRIEPMKGSLPAEPDLPEPHLTEAPWPAAAPQATLDALEASRVPPEDTGSQPPPPAPAAPAAPAAPPVQTGGPGAPSQPPVQAARNKEPPPPVPAVDAPVAETAEPAAKPEKRQMPLPERRAVPVKSEPG